MDQAREATAGTVPGRPGAGRWAAGRLCVAVALALLGGAGSGSPASAQVNCNVGIDFYPTGAIRSCILNGHHRIHTARGLPLTCADGHRLALYEDGRLASCTLASPLTTETLRCGAGRRVEVGPDGTLTRCGGSPVTDGDDDGWHYRIGQRRPAGQANLCRGREVALELARVFEREGARAGFAALERSPGCGRREESFTPRAVVTQVAISTSGGEAYTVSFVEVATAAGAVEYLVTTREVRP